MLYELTNFSDGGDFFNLFRYITFRAGAAFFTALIFGFIFGKPLINLLRRRQKHGQPIREDGPESHLIDKAGTPTMGGLLILSALVFSTLLWARWDNGFVWMVLFVTVSFGAIGFADDYAKVAKNNTKGVSGKIRFGIGLLVALLAGYWAMHMHSNIDADLMTRNPDHLELSGRLALPVLGCTAELKLHFCPLCDDRHCWCREFGQPDGWSGWPGYHARDDCGGNPWRHCLCRWAR